MILIVRHGKGRGRIPDYMQRALDRLRDTSPGTHRGLRFHETGAGERANLDGVSAVVFWLADPLRETYPRCFEETLGIEERAREKAIRLVNPPSVLSHSRKSVQAGLWRAAGIPSPRGWGFAGRADFLEKLEGCPYPLIVRADDEHVQASMRVCESRGDAESLAETGLPHPGFASSLVDVRAGYRESAPDTVWSRFHHKMRTIVLGGRVLAHELFFSTLPIVAARTCTFRRFRKRRLGRGWWARRRWDLGPCLEADVAYWRAGQGHAETMRAATRALGFDYAAIDYAVRSDGSPVLWEANPHFSFHPPHEMYLPEERLLAEREREVHDALGDWFDGLLS